MSKENSPLSQLSDVVDRLISEHTRLRVENQSLVLRVRELERVAASSDERVNQAKARLDALIAQLPLEDDAKADEKPVASQKSLL